MSSHSHKPSLQTEWAEERTVLAIERTYASWQRTGLAALGVALGMHAIFGMAADGAGLGRLTALLFVAIAVVIFIGAEYQARQLQSQLDAQCRLPLRIRMTALTAMLTIASLAAGVLIWRA